MGCLSYTSFLHFNLFFDDNKIWHLLMTLLDDIDIEYLKINIDDNSSVPIKLSFPVAFQFLD